MNGAASFLHELEAAAEAAKAVELKYRKEAAGRIAMLEEERVFAFRRLNLIQAITEAASAAESEEIAVANALARLRMLLGWSTDNEARTEVLSRFGPVALAIARASGLEQDDPHPGIGEALAAFERSYRETRGASFWALFEHPMPETPRVDF